MPVMAAQRKSTNDEAKKPKRKGKPLSVWIDDDLWDAINRLRKKHRRKVKDEVSIALEEYASKHGEYTPKPTAE